MSAGPFSFNYRRSRPMTNVGPLRLSVLPSPMIRLQKLGRTPQPFHLNPDLILTVEANPDTVVVLTTGSRLVVVESPEQVAEAVRTWRASVLDAMTRVPRRSQTLALVRGTAGDGAIVALNAEHARQESELPQKGPRS
jgi:uncharacterized protein YlzI (FlbEa/FlbD family)